VTARRSSAPDLPIGPADRSLSIFIMAGEPSGDALGARLMAALERQAPCPVRFDGVGGEAMAGQGLRSLFPSSEVSLMGILELLPHLRRVLRRIGETAAAAAALRPDAVFGIDAPGFTLRVAPRLAGRGIPLVHYVAPTVWAWRPGRAEKVSRYLDLLLALLPFEPPYFERHGLRCVYVGHPVIETVPRGADGPAFRRRHGLDPAAPLLVVLPGSRRGEVGRLLPIFAATLALVRQQVGNLRIVVPTVAPVHAAVEAWAASLPVPAIVTAEPGEKYAAFAAGDAALAASGTVTLELAALRLPTVLAYRTNPLSAAIVRRLITTPHVGLVNILAGRAVEPEYLQERCRPADLAAAIVTLLIDPAARAAQVAGFDEVMGKLVVDAAPSSVAAAAILDLIATRASGPGC
jgi:lipid-A-disaccharide synthase